MSDLAFVTTCRDRLGHLKASLPTFLAQPGVDCVVVDYDCPQQTAAWVAANHPQVKVVRAHDKPLFEISRARNMGAEATDATWLCFVDADNRLARDFAQQVRPLLVRGAFYRPHPQAIDGSGICIVHAEDFRAIGGYDAVMQGYGMDDLDLYMRLKIAGVREAAFPGELIEVVRHGVELRVVHYEVKSVRLNAALNQLYCQAKWDLMRLKGPMTEPMRTRLYRQVSRDVLRAREQGQDLTFRVGVDVQRTNIKTPLSTFLVYELVLTGPAAI